MRSSWFHHFPSREADGSVEYDALDMRGIRGLRPKASSLVEKIHDVRLHG